MPARSDHPPIRWRDVRELRPHPRNPRANDGAPVEAVATSIERFGFAAPIVVWAGRDLVVAGHTRIKAVGSLLARDPLFVVPHGPGPGLVPVVEHDFADEGEALAYLLVDNRASELAAWDDDLLAARLREVQDDGGNLLDLAWSEEQLAHLLERVAEPFSVADALGKMNDAEVGGGRAEPECDRATMREEADGLNGTGGSSFQNGTNSPAALASSGGGAAVPLIQWGRYDFHMTRESAALLTEKLAAHRRERGSLDGVGGRLVRAL